MCIAANGNRYCYSCHQNLPPSNFTKLKSSQDGLDYYCRTCKKNKNSKYYKEKYKAKKLQQDRERKQELLCIQQLNRDKIQHLTDNLQSNGCCICGEKELCCLDFHHIDPKQKQFLISQVTNRTSKYSYEDIVKEISKCVVVCSNCHRKIHSGLVQLK
jgi:hypothetical protein